MLNWNCYQTKFNFLVVTLVEFTATVGYIVGENDIDPPKILYMFF